MDMLAPYRSRCMMEEVMEMHRHFPCVLITGARQTGKSTMLQEMMPEGMTYLNMDDVMLCADARNNPIRFLEQHGTPLCIDEIQYVPELFRSIKLIVDRNRRPGMFWLSGSQRFHLMQGVSESLAGRIGIVDLYTMSQREAAGQGLNSPPFSHAAMETLVADAPVCSKTELFARIWRGGYPELVTDETLTNDRFFSSYVSTYIERDVHALTQVTDRSDFARLMRAAAMRTGQQLVYSNLAQDVGVSPKTVQRWLSVLETSGIISLLEPYSVNTTKRLVKAPKLYFTDTGLCCWLCGLGSPEALLNSPLAGAMLETYAYGQILRSYANRGQRPRLCYYRDKNGAEVDFLLEADMVLTPVEVKMNSLPQPTDLKAARGIPTGFCSMGPGIILCTEERLTAIGDGITAFPISGI